MYSIEADGTILKTSYESKGAVAKFLNVQHGIITSHLDKWVKGGLLLLQKGGGVIMYLAVN